MATMESDGGTSYQNHKTWSHYTFLMLEYANSQDEQLAKMLFGYYYGI
jgi:hypothetical protein